MFRQFRTPAHEFPKFSGPTRRTVKNPGLQGRLTGQEHPKTRMIQQEIRKFPMK
jgi:hypothetical protein